MLHFFFARVLPLAKLDILAPLRSHGGKFRHISVVIDLLEVFFINKECLECIFKKWKIFGCFLHKGKFFWYFFY